MILDSEWNELWQEKEDLRQKLDASEKESANRWSIIKDDCHTEEQVKQIALKHLTKEQVEGDSYGVPNSADLCQMLSAKLTAVTQERDKLAVACEKIREGLDLLETIDLRGAE